MPEPIIHYGLASTDSAGAGMTIAQHERIVGQRWSQLVDLVAQRNYELADKQAEIERRERGLQRVYDAIKIVCPNKEQAIMDKALELRSKGEQE